MYNAYKITPNNYPLEVVKKRSPDMKSRISKFCYSLYRFELKWNKII